MPRDDPNQTTRTATATRALVFDIATRSASDGDGIPCVVSTDAVINMPDGPEMLMHTPSAVDMTRAPLPIIATHAEGQLNVGVVDNLHLVGGQMRGIARFGARPEAIGYRDDVMNGTIRSISVGYVRIHAMQRRDGVIVTDKWMPLHAAMVGEPADSGAGFFRNLSTVPAFQLETSEAAANSTVRDGESTPAAPAASSKGIAMSDATTASAGANAETQVNNDGTQLERLRIRTINDLCRQHKIDDKQRDDWVDKGLTIDVASSKILDVLAERGRNGTTESVAKVGLSGKETRTYSLHRAIQSIMANGNWDKAGLEFEAHKAIQTRLNRDCGKNSFYVPVEVQERDVRSHEKRDLTVASNSGGGYLVETSNQGFIDLLRNRSVIMAMGARRLTGLQGNLTVPKQTTAATAYWLSTEATSITEGNQVFGQMALSPKNVGAYVEISRQLLLQSSPSAEQITMTDLAIQLGLAVDTAGIAGSGASGQPTGILTTSGIGTSPSGTSLDYPNVIKFQTDVAGGNALTSSCGYVTTPTVAGLLMGRQRFSSTNTPIWDGNMLDATVAGFRGMSSNQMPAGKMIFGDFQQVIVAEWGVLEVEVNPYANFSAGIVGVRAIYSVDIGIRYAAAFSSCASIT